MRMEYALLLIMPALLIAGCTSVNEPIMEPVGAKPTGELKEFTLEADDNGFYPASTISVNTGDTVKITFTIRTTNVYYAGLEIRSTAFETGQIPPGQSKTVEFTAGRSFQFTSHWPSSGVLKSIGQVNVS